LIVLESSSDNVFVYPIYKFFIFWALIGKVKLCLSEIALSVDWWLWRSKDSNAALSYVALLSTMYWDEEQELILGV